MANQHIVKSFDEELRRLTGIIARMGGMAENQLAQALEAVERRDDDLASQVIETDREVDKLCVEVEDFTARLLALRQPVAGDLRTIIAALRISAELERIADYAKNIAKRAIILNRHPSVQPDHAIPRMGAEVQSLLKQTLDAYSTNNAEKAQEAWLRDEAVDELYNSLFRELLTYMMEDPRSITSCTHLLFMAKNIERIGDHTTNIAEAIYYAVSGSRLSEGRPKGKDASLAADTVTGE